MALSMGAAKVTANSTSDITITKGVGRFLPPSALSGVVRRLLSRNGHSVTNLFGPVSNALRGFPTSLLLDGEVIAINDEGQPQTSKRSRLGCGLGTGSCLATFATCSLTVFT